MFDRRIFGLVPAGRRDIVLSVLMRWLALCAQIVLYFLLGHALCQALGYVTPWSVPQLAAGLGVCLVIWLGCTVLAGWWARRAGDATNAALTERVYGKVLFLGASRARYVTDAQVKNLMGEGIGLVVPYVSRYIPQFFYALAAPVTLFVVLAFVNVPTAVVLLVFVPLMPASIMILMTRAKKYLGDYWGTYVDLGGAFMEAVSGLTTLVVYGADGDKQQQLDAQAEEFRRITMALLRVQLNSVTFMDLFTYLGIAVGLLVAALQVAAGALAVPDAVVTALLAGSFFLPMRTFGSLFHTGMNAQPVLDEVFALLDASEPEVGDMAVQGEQVTFEVRGLSYRYADTGASEAALRGLDLDIRPNSFIGITGPSGGGKSTLVEVLSGALAGYEGSICVNGVELRDADPARMGDVVTVVSNRSHVFAGTFRTNLLLASPQAPDAALWEALRQMRLDEFVLSCGGLDAPVAEGGEDLSGGQRQRLCLARALLRNTPVYVFDEATSNVDARSEQLIMAAIQKLALSKTIVLATHRLRQLVYADEILVMDAGAVVQRGDHPALVREAGCYRDLWDQTEQLEAFAQEIMDELPPEAPDPLEKAFAAMPGMMAGVMRSFVSIMKTEHMTGTASAVPAGHPAWIPLPDYQAGMADAANESADAADVAVDAVGTAEKPAGAPDEAVGATDAEAQHVEDEKPDGMAGFVDATLGDIDPDDAERIRGAMQVVRDAMRKKAPQAVRVQVRPPAKRRALVIVRRLMGLTQDVVPELCGACLLGFAGWLCAVGVVAFAGLAVLAAAGWALPLGVPGWVALSVVCALARGPLHYAERLLTHDQTFRMLARIRSAVFAQMRRLAPAKLEGRGSGDLVALLTDDIDLLEGFYSRGLAPLASSVLVALVMTVVLGVCHPLLGCLALVCFVVIGGVLPAISGRLTRARGAELRAYAVAMTNFLLDSLAGMGDLLRLGRASDYADELQKHSASYLAGQTSHDWLTAVLDALPAGGVLVAVATYLHVATTLAVGDLMAPTVAVVSSLAFAASLEAARSVVGLGLSLPQTLAAADRVLDVFDEEPAVCEASDAVDLEAFSGLSVEGVSFSYGAASSGHGDLSQSTIETDFSDGMACVLDDVTLQLDPGSFVGLAGKSGAGKSTLLKLMLRFWDPSAGSIRVGGVDIRQASLGSLRRLQSYMTQDTYLFQDTIRKNLLVAKADATDGELWEALEQAALANEVRALPAGLDTLLGAQNHQLSDGQRQRIGLARAFLSGAPLMLLDEPTSHLDALNEAAILRALCQNVEGRTVVIVSHRKAVAAIMDRLLVLESDLAS